MTGEERGELATILATVLIPIGFFVGFMVLWNRACSALSSDSPKVAGQVGNRNDSVCRKLDDQKDRVWDAYWYNPTPANERAYEIAFHAWSQNCDQ